MDKKYEVFKKGSYKFDLPMVIDGVTTKNTDMANLSEENDSNRLGFGFFRMDNTEDSFTIESFPFDEVVVILEGIYNARVGEELIKLKKGDVFYMKKGLNVTFSSDSYVEAFYANYPV